jgi:hypothetical protein
MEIIIIRGNVLESYIDDVWLTCAIFTGLIREADKFYAAYYLDEKEWRLTRGEWFHVLGTD